MLIKRSRDCKRLYKRNVSKNKQENGLIITGDSGAGKTHLAASISNELIEKDKLVLMGRLTSLLDMIKRNFLKIIQSRKMN